MQLTRLDRWLLKRFVYETHVYTMRHPGELPHGVEERQMPDQPGRRFSYLFVSRDDKVTDAFIALLKAGNLMFTTRIVDRKDWLTPIVAPEGKSFTWRCVWVATGVTAALMLGSGAMSLWANPEVRKVVMEALEVFKG
jgi:hypothetical protein